MEEQTVYQPPELIELGDVVDLTFGTLGEEVDACDCNAWPDPPL